MQRMLNNIHVELKLNFENVKIDMPATLAPYQS